MKIRCQWCEKDDLYRDYHDKEWGVPVHDDRKWFEYIVLDGMQAGLSWYTVLKKRNNFRAAFDNFDPAIVALYDETKITALLADEGIIRNKAKIRAAVRNAQAFLAVQKEYGSFDTYIWQFTDNKTIDHACNCLQNIPVSSPESDAMSKNLQNRGFTFVGTTICYAFMQAAGMVNDHIVDCFRYKELKKFRHSF